MSKKFIMGTIVAGCCFGLSSISYAESNATEAEAVVKELSAYQAVSLESETIEQGQTEFKIAIKFLKGIGVEQNKQMGYFWLKRAASNGHAKAQALLSKAEQS